MAKYPSQMQDKFNLRFPEGMRDEIAERAKQNGRSMNSEIIQILQAALDADRPKEVTEIDILEREKLMVMLLGGGKKQRGEDYSKELNEIQIIEEKIKNLRLQKGE